VSVLGRKKALEILYATEDIEENGGMLTTVSFINRLLIVIIIIIFFFSMKNHLNQKRNLILFA
jgi:hypothetical protein